MSRSVLVKFSCVGAYKPFIANSWPLLFNRTISTDFTRSYSVPTIPSMRFIRFQKASDNKVRVGALSDDGKSVQALDHLLPNDMIDVIKSNVTADSIGSALKTGKWEPLTSDIRLLAPIQNPEKVACIGLNYLGHCKEQNKEAPKEPMFFSKFASAITGPTGDVILHEPTKVRFTNFKSKFYQLILFVWIML